MRRLHYAYVVVAVVFLSLTITSGVRSVPGVIIRPLEAEFGWDRASISLAVAISILTLGIGGIVSGAATGRFGPRAIGAVGLVVIAVGTAGTMAAQSLPQLYLGWGLLVGTGTGIAGGVISATIAHRWFKEHRSLIVGLFGGAGSAGQMLLIPLLATLTVDHGWRAPLALMAAVTAIAVIPAALLVRDRPSDVGLLPVGAAPDDPEPSAAAERSTPVATAMRTRDFWLLAGSFFVCGYTSNGLIGTHLIPHAVEHGFTEVSAAGAVAVMGGMNLVGSLASGWLTDRHDPRRLLGMYYGLRALSLAALPFIFDMQSLYLFAILYGLDWIATVPPTTSLIATIYGRGSLGPVYGMILFGHMIGASIAAFAGGFFHDVLGDYHLMFVSATLMGFVAVGLVSGVARQTPARERGLAAAY